MYIVFSNPGEIDPRLITTMGVNVKENPAAFGHFGTGLKYAIAIILRLGGTISIQTGRTEILFYPVPTTIRGKDFTLIGMGTILPTRREDEGTDYKELAFTTDLGKNWQPWMAYRELYCNAIDEGGKVSLLPAIPAPEAGETHIVVNCPAIENAHAQSGDWLLNTETRVLLWKTSSVECYSGSSRCGFYHGIKVTEFSKPTHFTYNIIDQKELTEDRTMAEWLFTNAITSEVIGRNRAPIPAEVLMAIITAKQETAEHNWSFPSWIIPRQEIIDYAEQIVTVIETPTLSPNILSAIRAYRPIRQPLRTLFDDLQDDAPPIPPHTCGAINATQERLSSSVELLGKAQHTLSGDNKTETVDAVANYIQSVIDDLSTFLEESLEYNHLEQLRAMNEQLRASGIYWRNTCKDLTIHEPSRKVEESNGQ